MHFGDATAETACVILSINTFDWISLVYELFKNPIRSDRKRNRLRNPSSKININDLFMETNATFESAVISLICIILFNSHAEIPFLR